MYRELRGLRVCRRMKFRVDDERKTSVSDAEGTTQVKFWVDRVAPFQTELDRAEKAVSAFDKSEIWETKTFIIWKITE